MSGYDLSARDIARVRAHIQKTWDVLTVTYEDMIMSDVNTKLTSKVADEGTTILVPPKHDFDIAYEHIRDSVSKEAFAKVTISTLTPRHVHSHPDAFLYLPHAFVVPGGRFSEMYGWDSYFIILGLLQDGRLEMARNMADNLLYEVNHYGKMLNANKSYYLTRSQPPILSQSVLAVYGQSHDKVWLQSTLADLEKFYAYWLGKHFIINGIGLSRYYAESCRPLPDAEVGYHDYVRQYFRERPIKCYNVNDYYDFSSNKLKSKFYRADRTVRETGFDLSNKFGPFGADILNYVPVSLNTLLCQMEKDIACIYKELKQNTASKKWEDAADLRAERINRLCWDESLGYYFDHNYKKQVNRLYIYATTFYPLMTGIASPAQAEKVIANLPVLESNGGIMSSAYVTGMQWDACFGWAPHQLFTVWALKKYGAVDDANRIATKYVSMINKDFRRTGKLYEKYNMKDCSSDVVKYIKNGYKVNAEGFGWTNAVYLLMLEQLGL